MSDDLLESLIIQQINAATETDVFFTWHGGEPTLFGLHRFQRIVAVQRQHSPPGKRIFNGIQTNGTLLDESWCRFLADENFFVGISLDGPQLQQNKHRHRIDGSVPFEKALTGYNLLRQYGVSPEILCVVHADNVHFPLDVYGFFKELKATAITFLPLVESSEETDSGFSSRTVPPEAFGTFLCTIFDEWVSTDIGKIKIQIFEEAARTAFGQDHTLCIFKKTCGNVPVIEQNGDFYSCDFFVRPSHRLGNINEKTLSELLDSPEQKSFGLAKQTSLPEQCHHCDVLDMCNGGCPKNRFPIQSQDGKNGLNYLCAGYKKFFTHCLPFLSAISELWNSQTPESP